MGLGVAEKLVDVVDFAVAVPVEPEEGIVPCEPPRPLDESVKINVKKRLRVFQTDQVQAVPIQVQNQRVVPSRRRRQGNVSRIRRLVLARRRLDRPDGSLLVVRPQGKRLRRGGHGRFRSAPFRGRRLRQVVRAVVVRRPVRSGIGRRRGPVRRRDFDPIAADKPVPIAEPVLHRLFVGFVLGHPAQPPNDAAIDDDGVCRVPRRPRPRRRR